MNNVRDGDFLKTFPPALQKDEKMKALGIIIARELHRTAEEVEKSIVYSRIDELEEKWLDVLAYDFHVDWYDYDYPVDIKRKILKNSVQVHQKLGTKKAVQSVLQDIYKTANVREWFEYGGKPYTFRLDVQVQENGISEDQILQIIKNMMFYKNLRSHCEAMTFDVKTEVKPKVFAILKVAQDLKVKVELERSISATAAVRTRAIVKEGVDEKTKAELSRGITATAGIHTRTIVKESVDEKTKTELQRNISATAAVRTRTTVKESVDEKTKAELPGGITATTQIKTIACRVIANDLTIKEETKHAGI